MRSVLQDWVMRLPLRAQGGLLTAVRSCDVDPKAWSSTGVAYSPSRRVVAWIRYCFMNAADPREVGSMEGAFMMDHPPSPFKPSAFGHMPLHWYSHVMHALEIIGFYHPDTVIRSCAYHMYRTMAHSLHLNEETKEQLEQRLNEDRIVAGTVVS
jgi:hypothetical protein